MIELRNIERTFRKGPVVTPVLKGISFQIPPGQLVAIVGPSGAGKSTLLYQMSMLDHPSNGQVIIDGVDTTRLGNGESSQYRLENFGFVFQDYALVPELTAAENIMITGLMRGLDHGQCREEAESLLVRLGMDHAADKLPSHLSGGEQQRVSVARAIAQKPKILFADEPTANLDSKNSQDVMELLIQLNRGGQTIVMVTHEMEYARMAHRIIELRDGRVSSDKMMSK